MYLLDKFGNKSAYVAYKCTKYTYSRVQNSSWLPGIAGSFSTFAGNFVIEKKENKTILINELLLLI
jgi:hypothetical protein